MKKLKNIWIFNHYAVIPDLPGGTRHFDFAKELTRREYNVTIFASSFIHSIFKNRKFDDNGTFYNIENYEGVRFVWIKTFHYTKNNWRRAINIFSYFWKAYFIGKRLPRFCKKNDRPDIIIGSSVHPFATFIANKLAKYYKIPFIFEIRDLWPQSLIDMKIISKNSLITTILLKLEKLCLRDCRAVISLSPLTENYLKRKYNIPPEKIFYIPNGVNLDNYSYEEYEKKEDSRGFVLTYTGNIANSNFLEVIIDVAKILKKDKNIIFKIYGSGSSLRDIKDKIDELKLNNIFILPPVQKKEIPYVLKMADVLILPTNNVYYGSENKLYDYLAAEKPILYINVSSHNYIEGTGIRVKANPSEIVKAILKLYNFSEPDRKKMAIKGRKYVEKNHSIPILVDKLEKIINDVYNETK